MRTALALKPDIAPPPAAEAAPATKSLLRFITCGSVDDGKSTLLGRLLFETNSVFEDQAEALARDSERFGTTGKEIDYALLVDGLSAEREQGITIDVAYRYFGTPKRSFIAADTPGHEQYTRNMATGASTADCAIILIDARKGLLPQTRRHSYIVSMLGVRDVIVAINKMDLVGYDEAVFRAIEADYRALVPALGFTNIHVIPLSARAGENIARRSEQMPWHLGPDLLSLLESIEPTPRQNAKFRLPVQWVNRPDADFRGFSGTISGGEIRIGDPVRVMPRGQASRVAGILTPRGEAEVARDGEAITLRLADEIDVSRGDVIASEVVTHGAIRSLSARLLALTQTPIVPGKAYRIKLGTMTTGARLMTLDHAIDIHTYQARPAAEIALNGIGRARLHVEVPVHAVPYNESRVLGSFLLIDPVTNEAAGLGVIEAVHAEEAPKGAPPGVASNGAAHPLVQALERAGALPPGAEAGDIRRHVSWRLFSGLIVTVLVAAFSGSLAIGLAAGLLDIVARPVLHVVHAGFWRLLAAYRERRAQDQLGIDGGGI